MAEKKELDIVVAPKTLSSLPTITVRPLYVVPARKTRRRGERAGVAYVLLIAPKVEHKHDNKVKEQDKKGPHVVPPTEESTSENTSKASPKAVTSTPPVDFTRQLARYRLMLSNALDALRQVAEEDRTKQEFFSGCIVEQSLNGKTWKPSGGRPDRREGTIESTLEFKKWLESTAQQKEALKSRPKPIPGGGVTGAGGDGQENGEAVAALVQHLLAKKQEIKRKKALKKKKDDSKRKPKKEVAENQSKKSKKKTRRGGRGGVKGEDGKRKKKKKPSKTAGAASAPMAVLKPPATAGS